MSPGLMNVTFPLWECREGNGPVKADHLADAVLAELPLDECPS